MTSGQKYGDCRQGGCEMLLDLHVYLACIGNPGKSGAGVIIWRLDGSVISLLHEGLGMMTNNAAEYRALILVLNYASKKGFKYIVQISGGIAK
ncbi:uncharacterized protein [Miscanthus floridulus]|uniref:uncharacterized protein isoform X1 n=1 Tax=Miscanthus floridulus TaxID=154761 RepID=UPI00345AEC2B